LTFVFYDPVVVVEDSIIFGFTLVHVARIFYELIFMVDLAIGSIHLVMPERPFTKCDVVVDDDFDSMVKVELLEVHDLPEWNRSSVDDVWVVGFFHWRGVVCRVLYFLMIGFD
jgi:hypothetical protein